MSEISVQSMVNTTVQARRALDCFPNSWKTLMRPFANAPAVFPETRQEESAGIVIGYLLDLYPNPSVRGPAAVTEVLDAMREEYRTPARRPLRDLSGAALHALLHPVFREAWSAETADPDEQWSQAHPARGQNIATCLVAQHLLGGSLLALSIGRQISVWNAVVDKQMTFVQARQEPIRVSKSDGVREMTPEALREISWVPAAEQQLYVRVRERLLARALAEYARLL